MQQAQATSSDCSDTGFVNVSHCAALPELRAAHATDPANGAVRRIVRAFHV
jgi:hypothetical protein